MPRLQIRLDIRDRAMLHLAFAAGLRVSELVGGSIRSTDKPCPVCTSWARGAANESSALERDSRRGERVVENAPCKGPARTVSQRQVQGDDPLGL